jgi:hypothetical protein
VEWRRLRIKTSCKLRPQKSFITLNSDRGRIPAASGKRYDQSDPRDGYEQERAGDYPGPRYDARDDHRRREDGQATQGSRYDLDGTHQGGQVPPGPRYDSGGTHLVIRGRTPLGPYDAAGTINPALRGRSPPGSRYNAAGTVNPALRGRSPPGSRYDAPGTSNPALRGRSPPGPRYDAAGAANPPIRGRSPPGVSLTKTPFFCFVVDAQAE